MSDKDIVFIDFEAIEKRVANRVVQIDDSENPIADRIARLAKSVGTCRIALVACRAAMSHSTKQLQEMRDILQSLEDKNELIVGDCRQLIPLKALNYEMPKILKEPTNKSYYPTVKRGKGKVKKY